MTGRTVPRGRSPRVLLGVTGGIAAYKALEIVRLFRKEGWQVTVVMTRAARRFVGAESFRALTGNPVALELFPTRREYPAAGRPPQKPNPAGPVEHVDLAASSDLIVVAPATANIIGKLASGIADDLLSTLLLAVPPATLRAGRVVIAPAMNTNMWLHQSVQDNIARLRNQGYAFVTPESGELACGSSGPGRMAEPTTVLEVCRAAMRRVPTNALNGITVVVTAGRTEEPIDPVRILTNRSSGRLGVELSRAFAASGADVKLIAGPLTVPVPPGISVSHVTSTAEMLVAVSRLLPSADVLIMCAAVADYKPARAARTKFHSPRLALQLVRTPDILRTVADSRHHALVIGFSLDASLARARTKLKAKRLDLIVANPPPTAGSESIQATLVYRNGLTRRLPLLSKSDFATRLVGIVSTLLKRQRRANTGSRPDCSYAARRPH